MAGPGKDATDRRVSHTPKRLKRCVDGVPYPAIIRFSGVLGQAFGPRPLTFTCDRQWRGAP